MFSGRSVIGSKMMEGLELFQTPFGNWFVGLCGNRFVDLCGNQFVDLCGNQFVDLSETGSCPAPKGSVSFSEVGLRPTSLNLTKPLMAPAYRNWLVDLCVNRFVGA